jgi:hypothetical protein
MTLMQEIQRLLETTYSQTGISLEDCLIGSDRCLELSELAGNPELSPIARTFLRQEGDCLHIAIYYAEPLIELLENHDPREAISEKNVAALIQFTEEIDHGVQAALQFQKSQKLESEGDLVLNLEVMGKVDTYLVLGKFICCHMGETMLTPEAKRWLTDQIFDKSYELFHSRVMEARYKLAQDVAAKFLSHLKEAPMASRRGVLRRFGRMSWAQKVAFVEQISPSEVPATEFCTVE